MLNYGENILAIYQKASCRLGFVKRTLHFVKDQKKKRAFYLALVRSLFEHCSAVWRPSSSEMIQKFECIQRRAIKWILSEQDHHYNDYECIKRLKEERIWICCQWNISSYTQTYYNSTKSFINSLLLNSQHI